MESPEAIELKRKQAELEALSDILADKELALEELTLSITGFQHRYYTEVGIKYVELDDFLAQIAERRAKQKPKKSDLRDAADRARVQAQQTSQEYEDIHIEAKEDVMAEEASEEVKKLYRKIASAIHPDKATDEYTRHLRTSLMCELNGAYAKRNIADMQHVLEKWQESPEAIPGDDTAAELVRTIRAIAQVTRRTFETTKKLSEILSSDIHELMTKVHTADLEGRDLLAEMASSLNLKIKAAKNELQGL